MSTYKYVTRRIAVRTPKPGPVYLSPVQRHLLTALANGRSEQDLARVLQMDSREFDMQLMILRELDLVAFTSPEMDARPTLPAPAGRLIPRVNVRETARPRAHRMEEECAVSQQGSGLHPVVGLRKFVA